MGGNVAQWDDLRNMLLYTGQCRVLI